ncbi:hypothetical protein PG993_009443 [Apiospora rasikravindrae]|uniref:Uncharacterized protein n=1 Tax=Apiospora rasikravindrae TaxID=990691 RepID=A0ABR1SJF2_9PEZI
MDPYIVAANEFSSLSLEEVSSPTSALALKEKKRKSPGDGSGVSGVKRQKVHDNAAYFSLAEAQAKADEDEEAEQLLPGYVADLKRWRDGMPVAKTKSQLPFNWHFKPLLEVLRRCPALFDLWVEVVASGDQLFERTPTSAFGYLLPRDFVGMSVFAVTEKHPRFEDLIDRGVFEGRIITRDSKDDFWIRYRSQSRQKVRGWLNNLPATWDSPPSTSASTSLSVASVASTQVYDVGRVNQGGEQVSLNIIPNDFLSLSLSRVLTLVPRIREVLEGVGIGGLYGTSEGRVASGISQSLTSQRMRMGHIMERFPKVREALIDLLLNSILSFADVTLQFLVQGVRIWRANGTCSHEEARVLVSGYWDRLSSGRSPG